MMFDTKTNRVYGRIKKEGGVYIVFEPHGIQTKRVFMTLDDAKKSCRETMTPFELLGRVDNG